MLFRSNAADVEMFTADENVDLAGTASWRKENEFVVMYTGAHGLANDLDIALAAARILKDRGAAIRFVFVGSGKEKARLVALSEALKLANVTFLPPVSKAEIKNLIAAADAGLAILKAIPEFTTTYPNKVFDFMAAGKPVLCQIDGVIGAQRGLPCRDPFRALGLLRPGLHARRHQARL